MRAVAATAAVQSRIPLALWGLGLLTFPFYFMGKGAFQLSSLLFVLAFWATVHQLEKRDLKILTRHTRPFVTIVTLLVAYTAVVALVWAIVLSTPVVLMAPVYYLFDLGVVLTAMGLYRLYGIEFINFTRWAIFASVCTQFVLSLFFANRGFREKIFFNNPNQLGYYSLVCASLMALPVGTGQRLKQDIAFGIGVLMCLWLATLSLSKAATVSIMAFLALSVGRNKPLLGFCAVAGVALFTLSDLSSDTSSVGMRVENLFSRLGDIGNDNDDNLAGRGYDRIWNYPEMLLLGAGEMANQRWYGDGATFEIHSTLGTIAFSYGVPGMLLFATMVGYIMWRGGWRIVLFMIPELMYSLVHMSLRFVMTWVYLSTLVLIALEWHKRREQKKAAARKFLLDYPKATVPGTA